MGMIACYQMATAEQIGMLQGMDAEDLFETVEELQEDADVLDIDKMWDGLHFLLTSASAAEPIKNNALSEAIVGKDAFFEEEDVEFIAYTMPEHVKEVVKTLETFDIVKAIEQYDPKQFAEAGIYPNIWMHEDRESIQEELLTVFGEMTAFYKKVAEQNMGILVSIY